MVKPAYDNYGESRSFPGRLQELADAWQRLADVTLRHRQKLLSLWASGFYTKGYARQHTLNLIDRGVSTIVPFLIEGNPSVMVEALIPTLRSQAYIRQLAVNYLIEKMNIADVLIRLATNSMFGMGISRTAFVYDRLISLDDEDIKIGTPRVEVIDDSNYIGDPCAKRREDFTFEGDVYQLPTEYARDLFPKYADYILPDCRLGQDRSPQDVSRHDFDRHKLSLRDYTTFIDLYLRDENAIVTIMPKGKKAKLLKEVDWDGPGAGPYDVLAYKFFPDEPIPIPPAWSWHDIDVTVNTLVEKMRQQAESWKSILAYQGANEDDAKRIIDSQHMQSVRVEDIEAVQKIEFGGVNPLNFEWIAFMMNEQTKQGANADVVGGRGVQAPTLGQEQMLFNNATRIINNMYTRFEGVSTSIMYKLMWAFSTDPTLYVPVVREIPGVEVPATVWSQASQVGDFDEFVYKIKQYSTQRMSPETKYSRTMAFMTQWILPTLQLAASQGAELDVPTVSKILASYAGLDNFNQYYHTVIPTAEDMPGAGYAMQPLKEGFTGQANDSGGELQGSREANLAQQQQRNGPGTETGGIES